MTFLNLTMDLDEYCWLKNREIDFYAYNINPSSSKTLAIVIQLLHTYSTARLLNTEQRTNRNANITN